MENSPTPAATVGAAGGSDVPWPWKEGMLKPKEPGLLPMPWTSEMTIFLLSNLLGRKLRVNRGKAPMDTKGVVPGRVTILLDDEDRIRDMWVERDLPDK